MLTVCLELVSFTWLSVASVVFKNLLKKVNQRVNAAKADACQERTGVPGEVTERPAAKNLAGELVCNTSANM